MNMDIFPAHEPENMETFGALQYIIDKMPELDRRVLTEYFVHEATITEIARKVNKSRSVVYRILRNLVKLQETV